MRKRKLIKQFSSRKELHKKIAEMQEIIDSANDYRREHDHPLRDSRLMNLHYDHLVNVLKEYSNREYLRKLNDK